VRCETLRRSLAGVADGTVQLDEDERRHVAQCLRCQAELAQYRKLLRALRLLRMEVLEPSPGLVSDVLAGLSVAGERHVLRRLVSGRRAVYAGGAAASLSIALAALVVVVLVTRRRSPHR
jgi:hypothetical protein